MNEDEIALKLRAIKNRFISQRNQVLQEYSITRIEFDILYLIYWSMHKNKRVQASGMASQFEVSIPAVMHKLDDLEAKGMVEKHCDSQDRRVKYYALTQETMEKCEKLFAKQKEKVKRYFEALGEEKKHLIAILDITLDFLEDKND